MVRYVDYTYYEGVFLGETIPEESFGRIVREASAYIREITYDRIPADSVPDGVKDAVCAVCEVLYQEEQRIQKSGGTQEVKSMSTDGESVSYAVESGSGTIREEVMWEKKYAAARPYLIPTGLLYRGCC